MSSNKRTLKLVLSYVLVLLASVIALILSWPSIVTGNEMVFGLFMVFVWPISSAVSCFVQGRLRTKLMWFAP